jgi:hypothetical protein
VASFRVSIEDHLVIRISTSQVVALQIVMAAAVAPLAAAQVPELNGRPSIAIEADAMSYFIAGYSGILNLALPNGFHAAAGIGRYDVPEFLLSRDANFETAQWQATVTSVQVLRAGYRFKGPMRNGPALAAIVLNQNWRMHSVPLDGETRFRTLSIGISGGYYLHIGQHFYVYPTASLTHNRVTSGNASVNGTDYKVEKFGTNGSVHVGWAWSF